MSRCARPHVPEEEFHAWLDGALSRAQSAEIAEHLLACLICRALHAEVEASRDRASAILALAIPRGVRRALPAQPVTVRRTQRGRIAAGIAVLLVGGALVNQPATLVTPNPRLAMVRFVAPAMLAQVRDQSALPEATATPRGGPLMAYASQTSVSPRVVTPVAVGRRTVALVPTTDVDPAINWENITWEDALLAAGGSLARLEGLPVTAVRLQRNGPGVRPTFFVKQRLPDGRNVWVIEGPEDRVAPLQVSVVASGLASSLPLRTRPDYIGSEASPVRTIRLVTIAASLSKDSVDALTTRLRLE